MESNNVGSSTWLVLQAKKILNSLNNHLMPTFLTIYCLKPPFTLSYGIII